MRRPRVAVIGAGPAGSTAARLLAMGGASVALFEARRLPRSKSCGGGLTPKAQRLVPRPVLATVERRVHRVELRSPRLPPIRLVEPAASIAMVERDRFDLALVEAAARAGADVSDGMAVEGIVERETSVVVRVGRVSYVVDAAVVADGEPSHCARQLGLGGPARRLALALEVDVPFSERLDRETALLWFRVPGGYGWYFPKGDHANIGVGSHRPERRRSLRSDLAFLAHELGLDLGGRVRGHWIPQGLRIDRVASNRVVLAGDAAGTADPLFGEGISYAILSGIVAAQTIGEWAAGRIASLRPYDARLRSALGPALTRLDVVAHAAEFSITAAMVALRVSPRVRERAIDAIAGRRPPFVIDGRCEIACACDVHSPEPDVPTRLPGSESGQDCFRCAVWCAPAPAR